jgi:hypothetical protein
VIIKQATGQLGFWSLWVSWIQLNSICCSPRFIFCHTSRERVSIRYSRLACVEYTDSLLPSHERFNTPRSHIYASCLQLHKFVSKIDSSWPIILPATYSLYKLSSPLSLSDYLLYGFIISTMRATCPFRHVSQDFVIVILLMENNIITVLIKQLSVIA